MSSASFDALGTDRDLGSEAYRPADFPGCELFHLPASEIDHYEGRLEFWDGVTETAWKVCEPTSIQHEQPSRQLVLMAGQFAMVRGSRIVSFGSADLVRLDAAGRRRWLMQADVVLEVDHTTDERRRKLELYKESGFPEIWVLVPWEASVRVPGLTIHVRREDGYREESSSRVFPGWRAEEIHRALTEDPLSEPAWRALERTALAIGACEGTAPEHDPLTRSISLKAQARGRSEMLAANVLMVLKARGIEPASAPTENREIFSGRSGEVVMAAALACTDQVDFLRRIGQRRDVQTGLSSPADPEG